MKSFLAILFLVTYSLPGLSQVKEIDSLSKLLTEPQYAKDDTNRLGVLINLSYYLCFTDLDSAIDVSKEAIRVSKLNNDKVSEAKALGNEGYALSAKGKTHLAISRYLNAIVLFEEIDDKEGIVNSNINIGASYLILGNRKKALEYNELAYKMAKQEDIAILIIVALINLGEINEDTNLDVAIKNYMEALENIDEIVDYRKPLLERSLHIALGNSFKKKGEPNIAIIYYKTAHEKTEETDYRSLAQIYHELATAYIDLNRFNQAKKYIELVKKNATKIGDNPSLKNAYQSLSIIGEKTKNYKMAYENHLKYIAIKDSIIGFDKDKDIDELEARYQTEKQSQELEIQKSELDNKEQEIEKEKFQRNILIIVIALSLIFAFIIVKGFLNKKKVNKQLHYNNLLVTDSIDYARRIQKGVYPSKEDVWKLFPNIMVYLNPKDIVSGDFYWVYEKGNKRYLAVADCTGHGVPGAFMTIIGINILNEIMNTENLEAPAEIISSLNKKLREQLSVNRWGGKDGMDIALICIDEKEKSLQFCGTHLSCYIVENKQTTRLRGDNVFIGLNEKVLLSNQNYSYEPGGTVYLFTDGFPDQKGEMNGKKYYYAPFIEFLVKTSGLGSDKQYDRVKEEFDTFKGGNEQIDDVLVVGVKV